MTEKTSSDVKTRVLTALILLPLVFLIYLGGAIALGIVIIIGLVMAYETVTVAGIKWSSLRGGAAIMTALLPAVLLAFGADFPVNLLPPEQMMLICMAATFMLANSLASRIVLMSLALCVFSLVGILMMSVGPMWLLLTIGTIAAADSAAYFGGRKFGGAKLAPSISPSKTWSGACFGVAGGAIAAAIIGNFMGIPLNLAALMGLLIADVSIGGDLLESWFKRTHGVKDSGRILPGHGGFLDRFDGYLLALPFLYAAMRLGGLDGQ